MQVNQLQSDPMHAKKSTINKKSFAKTGQAKQSARTENPNCRACSWQKSPVNKKHHAGYRGFPKMHIKTYAKSHTITQTPNHRPLDPTVTLLNLQHTAARRQSLRNTVGEMQNGEEEEKQFKIGSSRWATATADMKGNERESEERGGRWRTYGVWRPSFLPLPSSSLFPLISHTWDH